MAKILVVEDDQFLRNAYNNILGKENFEVKIAENGTVGLQVAEEWRPDVIMLDLLMPGVDGIEFLKRFDAKAHPYTRVIVFSNMSLPEKVNEAIALGAADFKTKANFTPKDMVTLIRDTLDSITQQPAAPAQPAADDTPTDQAATPDEPAEK
jgi:DNA-binding NtrC family response regulator